MKKMRFDDKVVLVTGGGTGIGKSAAMAFATEGARVVVCGRRQEPLKDVVAEIIRNGGEATFFVCDVRKPELVDKLVKDTVDKYGGIHVLFNNAGVNISKPIEETSNKHVDDLIDINVKGEFWALRAVIGQMKKQGGGGAIVNMAYMSGLVGQHDRGIYCAGKGALVNMTRAIAMEVAGENIRVNCVCPGVIDTPMFREGLREAPLITQGYIDSTPMKRAASCEEVANVVLFLASDDASFVTGVNLAIDGGFTAGK